MAKDITQLPSLTTPANDDELLISDTSTASDKRITREDFLTGSPLPDDTVTTDAVADGAITNSKAGFTYSTYTPTLSGVTIGDGTLTSRVQTYGKTSRFHIEFVLGSTSAVTGTIDFTLPSTSASSYKQFVTPIGLVNFFDTSASVVYNGGIAWLTTSTARAYIYNTGGASSIYSATSSTVPFTWATGDIISISGEYENA